MVRNTLAFGARSKDLDELIDRTIELDTTRAVVMPVSAALPDVSSTVSSARASVPHRLGFAHASRRADAAEPGPTLLIRASQTILLRVLPLLRSGGSFRGLLSGPANRLSSPARAGALVAAASSCAPQTWVVLWGTLLWACESVPLSLLVDSGVYSLSLSTSHGRDRLASLASCPDRPRTGPRH